MRRIWAVARQTFSQCVRTKIAIAVILLLAVVLAVLPTALEGDGTLAGRIRTLMHYGLLATSALLTVVTVLMAVHVISTDVERKVIATVATKPLARWQYILGRWLGVVLLVGLILVPAAGALYVQLQYLRNQEGLNTADRQKVETEIFTARREVAPEPIGVEDEVERRLNEMRQRDEYKRALEAYAQERGGDYREAHEALVNDIAREVAKGLESAEPAKLTESGFEPGGKLRWSFTGLQPSGEASRAAGTVHEVVQGELRRGEGQEPMRVVLMRIQAPRKFVGTLLVQGPVRLNGREGRVRDIARNAEDFVVQMPRAQAAAMGLDTLRQPREVELVSEPFLQIRYKVGPSGSYAGNYLPGRWEVTNPKGSAGYVTYRRDPDREINTIVVPARLVDENGELIVIYTNLAQATMRVRQKDVEVLYPVGGFTANYLRTVFLMGVQLMFLAGVGVLFGSFLGFAVGVIVSFAVLPFGLFRSYLEESIGYMVRDPEAGPVGYLSEAIHFVMSVILPDLEGTFTVQELVDGLAVTWWQVTEGTLMTLGVRTSLFVLLACVIWKKRELARVQV